MTAYGDTPPTTVNTRSSSIFASIVTTINALCAIVPYALLALGLRLVMARVFFFDGQGKIDGPSVPININGVFNYSVVLPAEIKASTFQMFAQYPALPLPANVATYLFSYAEFILPVLLVLGFATRIASTLLLVMTVLMTLYFAPGALWTTHVYWISILLVLMSVGPGVISLDQVIRRIHAR